MDSNYSEKSKHESNAAVTLHKAAVALHGQGKPVDTATALLWSDNRHFSEVFNRTVFGTDLVKPKDLKEASTAEEAQIRLRDNSVLTLQRFRDVARAMQSGQILLILGLEDQQVINYEMPFRVLTMDFINYSRQVTLIEEQNRRNFTPSSKESQQAEYIGRFKKTDRLHPVITLVLYYGNTPRADKPV